MTEIQYFFYIATSNNRSLIKLVLCGIQQLAFDIQLVEL